MFKSGTVHLLSGFDKLNVPFFGFSVFVLVGLDTDIFVLVFLGSATVSSFVFLISFFVSKEISFFSEFCFLNKSVGNSVTSG